MTGCTKVSPGCKHCYAERMAKRLKAMGTPAYANGFKLTLQEAESLHPLKWKKPQRIFVNSMSDLFHKDVPLANYLLRVFEVMKEASWHRISDFDQAVGEAFGIAGAVGRGHRISGWVLVSKIQHMYTALIICGRRGRTNQVSFA